MGRYFTSQTLAADTEKKKKKEFPLCHGGKKSEEETRGCGLDPWPRSVG